MISTRPMPLTSRPTRPRRRWIVSLPSATAIFPNNPRRCNVSSKPRPAKSKPSKPQQEKPLALPEKLSQAQLDSQKWAKVAADPDLSPEAALAARNMQRSSQAALTLAQKASQQGPTPDPDLATTLGLPLPQDPRTSLGPDNPLSPT